jgi:glycosyltransferase involved in cell wall biosynthesis
MSGPPSFTVVIAAYNEEDYVGGAIRSVQRQTRGDWEAIVVDDGSADGTAELVSSMAAEDPRVRLVRQENAGLSAARNTAIELAETEYVSILDSDDLWLPSYLETMGAVLEAAPRAGWAYTDAWALDVDTHRFRRATAMSSCQPPDLLPGDPAEVMKLLVRQNFMWVSATVRRRALVEAGLFNTDYKSAEDIELWFRILALGYTVVRAPGVLGVKRERAEAMSRADLKNIKNLQRVMAAVAENPGVPREVQRLARERIGYYEGWRLALSGESRPRALALAARRKLGALRRALMRRYDWRSEPPAEVQAAFPELNAP